jgi:hypothetical protein
MNPRTTRLDANAGHIESETSGRFRQGVSPRLMICANTWRICIERMDSSTVSPTNLISRSFGSLSLSAAANSTTAKRRRYWDFLGQDRALKILRFWPSPRHGRIARHWIDLIGRFCGGPRTLPTGVIFTTACCCWWAPLWAKHVPEA